MLVLCIALPLLVLGIMGIKKYDDGWQLFVSIFMLSCGVVGVLIPAISLPIDRMQAYERIEKRKAFIQTLQHARASHLFSEGERMAILQKITEWNEWLASEKYWRTTSWRWWHLSEIDSLEAIE